MDVQDGDVRLAVDGDRQLLHVVDVVEKAFEVEIDVYQAAQGGGP